jgi:hypothetical protein
VTSQIELIRPEGFCGLVKENALVMIARHFQVWDNEIIFLAPDGRMRPMLGETHWLYSGSNPGPYMLLWSRSLTAWTIAHESIHGLPNGLPGGSGYRYHTARHGS